MMRSHRCGDLRTTDEGAPVALCGWVHTRRDHGGVIFIDLRDVAGLVQVVFNFSEAPALQGAAEGLRSEFCVRVEGEVRRRKEGTTNEALATGEIEVAATSLEVLSVSATPPFQVDEHHDVEEMLRLKYRYLDLRRTRMQSNLQLRHAIVSSIRRFYDAHGFTEVETPMLTRATPEGARDYLVPARLHPGSFYALPQSPQLFKQLLMVAGLDRYYQIVRCFRDEDLRADRQPDFTQLDVEMSFVDREDVLAVTEAMFKQVWAEVLGAELQDFVRLTFAESMARFGTDKPDLRFGMELTDLSGALQQTEFRVFQAGKEEGGAVKAIVLGSQGGMPRKQIDALVEEAKALGAGGLVWIAVADEGLRSPVEKFLSEDEHRELPRAAAAKAGDLILIVADGRAEVVDRVLGSMRNRLGKHLGLVPERARADPEAWKFAWIVDFPWFERDEAAGAWTAIHHPFTGITPDTVDYLESAPEKVLSKAYDITLNGWELASGSIRIHDRALQERVLAALGISKEEAQARFGFLLDAFAFGPPPHGGIAPGIDRIVALAAGEDNIREVIAFPKTQSAADPLTGAPAPVDADQLEALHLALKPPGPT